nr:hypothetical protein [Tanacetum cinerariifolium]
MLEHQGEGSGTPTESHHTPSPEADTSHPTTSSIPLPSIPTAPIPPVTQPDTTPIRQYSRRMRIAQSSALPTVADKPASPVRDVSKGEACPTESGFIADQDRATIAKSSTLPHDSAPRVTSPAADEGIIEFGDSYKVPTNTDPDDTITKRDAEQSGRTVTFTTEDMQKKKNDLKARTTLLLSLPDEHQTWPLFLPQRTAAMKMA